ncbi:MAG TPA: hypothetical protein VMK12_23605 [Anaeromyxobacteraceae bacterium]|nr:hypothetical protein [Anaeromyxobacteraceae bacterium]
MNLRSAAGLLVASGCAVSGGVPLAVGAGGHVMQCDETGSAYQILQDGTYVIHLESKSMGNKSGASLCIEPSPQGWRPPDPCRTDTRIDDWRADRGADWIVEARAGCALAVWLTEGNFTTRAATHCPAGARVDTASFTGSGGFRVSFAVTRP